MRSDYHVGKGLSRIDSPLLVPDALLFYRRRPTVRSVAGTHFVLDVENYSVDLQELVVVDMAARGREGLGDVVFPIFLHAGMIPRPTDKHIILGAGEAKSRLGHFVLHVPVGSDQLIAAAAITLAVDCIAHHTEYVYRAQRLDGFAVPVPADSLYRPVPRPPP